MRDVSARRTPATMLGILALVFWGSTIAFARSLSEAVGLSAR